MSLFYNLLDEHEALLKKRGYDEESLNSPYKKGWLMNDLKRNLSKAVNEILIDDSPTKFTLKATGFFNDDQDIVNFYLHYLFDPKEGSLEIKTLEMKSIMDRAERKMELKSSYDLPDSCDALQLIRGAEIKRKHNGTLNISDQRQKGRRM